ncbi:hypothetical protein [Hyalangium sp.]|uniref:hypothetical protein n=1 Tax=Hyalangium sp. TaxID=2028555 RepID=UPI002D6C1BE3|nr:hypothetical protein [Hyalangium sp.]HYH97352.1 hypothetical protein [Hyalangium sp.]
MALLRLILCAALALTLMASGCKDDEFAPQNPPSDAGADGGSGGADGGSSDSGTVDAGRGDTGTPDAGVDGGLPDGSAAGPGPLQGHVNGLKDLGPLPAGLDIQWPAAPTITREIDIDSHADYAQYFQPPGGAPATAQTRFRFHIGINETVVVQTSDTELILDPDVKLLRLLIGQAVHRVRVSGGVFGEIEFSLPWNNGTPEEGRFATDVVFDGVRVEPEADQYGLAFAIRAKRVAILNSETQAKVYSVWVGGMEPLQSTDIVLANNRFASVTGSEATVRMHNVLRTVTVHNRLTNGTSSQTDSKHNYRIHGIAAENFAARNLLVHSGVMIGEGGGVPVEQIGQLWFNDNVFHQLRPSLYQMGLSAVQEAQIRRNHAYTDRHDCFYCPSSSPPGWDLAENTVGPYTPAP